jgi:SET domain-containing protein
MPMCGQSISITKKEGAFICSTDSLEVRVIEGKGRGVFAKRSFKEGDLIERACVIPLSAQEEPIDKCLVLYNYTFGWGPGLKYSAIALGYGSLYNHSYTPNAYYVPREEGMYIDFVAYKDITPGQEITVNYNRDPTCQKPLWFDTN